MKNIFNSLLIGSTLLCSGLAHGASEGATQQGVLPYTLAQEASVNMVAAQPGYFGKRMNSEGCSVNDEWAEFEESVRPAPERPARGLARNLDRYIYGYRCNHGDDRVKGLRDMIYGTEASSVQYPYLVNQEIYGLRRQLFKLSQEREEKLSLLCQAEEDAVAAARSSAEAEYEKSTEKSELDSWKSHAARPSYDGIDEMDHGFAYQRAEKKFNKILAKHLAGPQSALKAAREAHEAQARESLQPQIDALESRLKDLEIQKEYQNALVEHKKLAEQEIRAIERDINSTFKDIYARAQKVLYKDSKDWRQRLHAFCVKKEHEAAAATRADYAQRFLVAIQRTDNETKPQQVPPATGDAATPAGRAYIRQQFFKAIARD